MYPQQQQQHQHAVHQTKEEPRTGHEDIAKEDPEGSAQYLTANCVLVTYFTGEISRVVDEHFDKALGNSEEEQGTASTKAKGELISRYD